MAFVVRRCVLASAQKALPKHFSRSLKTGMKYSPSKMSLGLCTAGVASFGVALWVGKTQSRDKESWSLPKLSSIFNSTVLSKSVIGSVSAQKKKGSLPPCGGKKKGVVASKASCLEPQRNVITQTLGHSLFLWITLDSSADQCEVARVASDIDALLCSVDDPCDPIQEEIIAGVGFGPTFYSQVMGKTNKNYYYGARKCAAGDLPCCCGDILLHVKCNDRGKLFEICKNYLYSFPEGSIREYEDIYGYDYKCGRDLSNFCINASNRGDEDGLKEVAVECESGGSYALAMKWVHDFCVIRPENKDALEKFIGRDMCGEELKTKTETAHVTRMRGSSDHGAAPNCEVVMQKHSYGTLSKGAGLFVLGFTSDPNSFEFMLDQMVGSGCDGCFDDVFKFSKNVKGTYFYFPGLEDLEALKKAGK